MKKFLVIFIGLFLLVGCTDTMNTPSKKVEDFLSKYQKLDSDVLTQLDVTIDNDTSMDADQKKDYRALMEKQYQNLSYKITDEKQEDNTATVDVEIEVFDYASSVNKSREYYKEHKDEFLDKDNKDNQKDDGDNKVEEAIDTAKSFIDYKIKELKNVEEKNTYQMTFNLTKEDGKWKLNDISDTDRQKLHGLY